MKMENINGMTSFALPLQPWLFYLRSLNRKFRSLNLADFTLVPRVDIEETVEARYLVSTAHQAELGSKVAENGHEEESFFRAEAPVSSGGKTPGSVAIGSAAGVNWTGSSGRRGGEHMVVGVYLKTANVFIILN